MRITTTCAVLLLGGFASVAQVEDGLLPLDLKNGSVHLNPRVETTLSSSEQGADRIHRVVQFDQIPNASAREEMTQAGLHFFHFLPPNAYVVSSPASFDWSVTIGHGVKAVAEIGAEIKLAPPVFQRALPQYALSANGNFLLHVVPFPDQDLGVASQNISKISGLQVLSREDHAHHLTVEATPSALNELPLSSWVYYVEAIDPPAEPENRLAAALARSNVIASELLTGYKYDGTGVNVAMGDDGIVGPHIDYQGRVDQSHVSGNSGDHGDHVGGTIMGAGNLDPLGRGMAFGAFMYVYSVWDAVNESDLSYNTEDIRITSTSYSNGCNAGYTQFTQTADQQINDNPALIHVFSAGNNGTSDCSYGAGAGWGNVTGGVKIGKNVLCVANLTSVDGLAGSSSRGPSADGRIKPDIGAMGTGVYSPVSPYTYANLTGTSMSCPGVSGTVAQLYHAYRDFNGGVDPNSALIKAVLLNGAEDIGNPGPDFKHGYGRMHARRSLEMLENGDYLVDSLDQNGNNVHQITVPAGTQELKVMVYWHDYEAATQAAPALVNDLDMTLTDPGNTTFEPWVLDTTSNATALDAPATRNADHVNNVEQVTLSNPVAGTYTISVDGYAVPQGPQKYYLVYYFIRDEIVLTYPMGGEALVPAIGDLIRWDAVGDSGTFTVEASYDLGSTWNVLSSTVAGTSRYYNYNPPSLITGEALFRVSRGGLSGQSVEPVSIIRVPTNVEIKWICPDSLLLEWDSVPGAIGYEVSKLGAKYMDSLTTVQVDSVVILINDPISEEWFSVKALGPNNCVGRRAVAVQKSGGVFDCRISNDPALSAIVAPSNGTLSSCNDFSSAVVKVELRNDGINPVWDIPVFYQVNGGTIEMATYADTLAPDSSATFSFTPLLGFIAGAQYNIDAWIALAGDENPYNDSTRVIVQTQTGTVYTAPFAEDFEGWTSCNTQSNCDQNCNLQDGWLNDENGVVDDIDWRTDRNGTPSDNTGPSTDYNPGTEQGKYLYLEASNGCHEKVAYLTSPCIDLTGVVNPQLSFRYHLYGGSMGELHVDVLNGTDWTLDVTNTMAFNQGNVWRLRTIDLSAFANETINVRFRGITGWDSLSDMAIDDINITDATGLPEEALAGLMEVYPNPARDYLRLSLPEGHQAGEVVLFDLLGQVVQTRPVREDEQNLELNVNRVAKGAYVLRFVNEQYTLSRRVVVE